MSLFACVREPPVLIVRHNALSIAAAVCFKKYALVSRECGSKARSSGYALIWLNKRSG